MNARELINGMASDFSDRQLIFLVSQPRAGSTLLQSLLAGVDMVHTTAEPWLMLHPLYALRETGHAADYDAAVAARALRDYLNELDEGEDVYYEAVRLMGLELYGRACRQAGKQLFLDKTPRYYHILPELSRVFPEARFIILFRNPAAVFSSILRTWMDDDWSRFDYFREDLLVAPRTLTDSHAYLADRAIVVHYEHLVHAPEAVLAELCARLGLPYGPQLLSYGERPLPAGRYGDPTGIRRYDRPSAASLNTWLEHARDPQIHHLISAYLDELGDEQIARMGYVPVELRATLNDVHQHPGRVSISWSRLTAADKSVADRARLLFHSGQWARHPRRTARRLLHLITS
jgi:hypothetical protein